MINDKPQNQPVLHFSTDDLPEVIAVRMKPLADELNESVIDLDRVKKLMSVGISDEAHLLR